MTGVDRTLIHGHFRTSQAQWPSGVRRHWSVGPAIDPSGHWRLGIRIAGPHSVTLQGALGAACGSTRDADPAADPCTGCSALVLGRGVEEGRPQAATAA